MDAGASGEILRGEGISESAKAEVPPQTPPSWPRGFSVGTGVLCRPVGWGKLEEKGKKRIKKKKLERILL